MIDIDLILNRKTAQVGDKLGIVVEIFSNGNPKIKFDGENIPSEKEYTRLSSYSPEVGDRVLLLYISGTYVVLGKVTKNE